MLTSQFAFDYSSHTNTKMPNISGNKRSADSEHKELVITNVEFAMLMFYKSQWEAQQQLTQQAVHTAKKLKRECDHHLQVRSQMADDIVNLQADLHDALQTAHQALDAKIETEHRVHQLEMQLNHTELQLSNTQFMLNMSTWSNLQVDTDFDDIETQPAGSDTETEPEDN